ncbi:MAG: hypothetical protein L6R37_001271 [Teloschistes peruensis]|nr:MAG: hypothetical protein L6R37_001271 [Teloschistes peruensis]
MADTLCGPSNPLQNFQKHASTDRALQQDRLTSRQLPTESFRTPNPNAGILDGEFEAFKAGYPIASEPFYPEQPWQNQHTFPSQPNFTQQNTPEWASDFQNLNLNAARATPLQAAQFRREAPLQRHAPTQWHQEFTQQNGAQGVNYHQPRFVGSSFGSATAASSLNAYSQQYGAQVGRELEFQDTSSFDDAAFDKAFDAAAFEIKNQGTSVQRKETFSRPQPEEPSDLPQEIADYRVGSDRIPDNSERHQEQWSESRDADELAMTAGQLLENVKHDQSTKFQQSNFLLLMRQLRDREVKVEGDKIVDVEQPLHPGGPDYPNRKDERLATEETERLSPSKGKARASSVPHSSDGSSVSEKTCPPSTIPPRNDHIPCTQDDAISPLSTSPSALPSNPPPPFSALYFPPPHPATYAGPSTAESDSCPPPPFAPSLSRASPSRPPSALEKETKAAFSCDTKTDPSTKSVEEKEPPPPYTEGSSPLGSFTYIMAAAGGPASIITQVPQGEPPRPPGGHSFADVGAEENISLDLRGTRFTLSREELLTLPEFVLLSLFPNGLLPDGHMNSSHEGDTYPVDYDPTSLQYMLDFFRTVAQTIPSSSPSPVADTPSTETNIPGSARDMLQDRAGIIVLREDLDFYAIPPKAEIDQSEMIEVKRAAGRALLKQDGIFSGLRKSEEQGTTEQHLIEMLTAG